MLIEETETVLNVHWVARLRRTRGYQHGQDWRPDFTELTAKRKVRVESAAPLLSGPWYGHAVTRDIP